MRVSLLVSLLVLPIVGGCCASPTSSSDGNFAAPADTSEVIVEAGGFTVTQAEWDAELLSIPSRARARYENDKAKKDLADRILLNKALFEDAKGAGVTDDPAIQRSAQMASEQAFIKAFFAKLEGSAATDEMVQAYYTENIDRYSRPMVRLRHILLKEEGAANDLMGQLAAGGDFAALAQEHSQDRASKAKGGDLNWATKERYVPAFAEAAFGLSAPGLVASPVKTRFGFHIIELLERRDVQPLEDVRSGIERVLVRDSVRDHRSKRREDLGLGAKKPAKGNPAKEGARPVRPGKGAPPAASPE